MINRILLSLICAALSQLSAATYANDDGEMIAHFINMGQADATLLEFSCGAVLIDAGAQYSSGDDAFNAVQVKRLTDYLDGFFARRIDLSNTLNSIIITHNHIDHTHGLREVAERYSVESYVGTGYDDGFAGGYTDARWMRNSSGVPHEIVTSGDFKSDDQPGFRTPLIDNVNCENADPDIRVLSGRYESNPGWPADDYKDPNNASLVVRVAFGEATFLFTGDLEEHGIETLLEKYEDQKELLDIDVYQVGHHGSHNATTSDLIKAMSPEISVISVGEWDYGKPDTMFTTYIYGHPREVTVKQLATGTHRSRKPKTIKIFYAQKKAKNYNVKDAIYATGWDGTVKVTATFAGKFDVTTEK